MKSIYEMIKTQKKPSSGLNKTSSSKAAINEKIGSSSSLEVGVIDVDEDNEEGDSSSDSNAVANDALKLEFTSNKKQQSISRLSLKRKHAEFVSAENNKQSRNKTDLKVKESKIEAVNTKSSARNKKSYTDIRMESKEKSKSSLKKAETRGIKLMHEMIKNRRASSFCSSNESSKSKVPTDEKKGLSSQDLEVIDVDKDEESSDSNDIPNEALELKQESISQLSLKRKSVEVVSSEKGKTDPKVKDGQIKVVSLESSVRNKNSDLDLNIDLKEKLKSSSSFANIIDDSGYPPPDSMKMKVEEKSVADVLAPSSTQPYYQKNFETILDSVVADGDTLGLFNETDTSVIDTYRSLSEQARRLFVRLFGRKFKWIPNQKIKYPEIADDLSHHLKELSESSLVCDESKMTDLSDVLETLSAADIKTLAKSYHLSPSITQMKQIVQELKKIAQRNTVSSMFGSKGGISVAMLKKGKALLKGAYKLQNEARSVFIRVMMLFSLVNSTGDEDSGNGGQGQLFQMLMVNMGKVIYPTYKLEKKHQVFKNREDILRFEHALQVESDLLHATEKGDWNRAYEMYCSIMRELESLQKDHEITEWDKQLPDFLRSFTATSVLYGLLSQCIDIVQRRKDYEEAVILIKKLLGQQLYCCSHRGYWWERLALNLDVHMKQPVQALEAIGNGLDDDLVIGGHRLALYQRAESICERPKLKLKHRLKDFTHSPIRDLPKVHLEGRILHQGVTSAGPRFLTEGSYSNGNAQDMTVCGVEEFVLKHYEKNGFPHGIHAEGSIVTSLFGLFFWDILFMSVPDAFHSLYQAQPLDLYSTTSFYLARKSAIDQRLAVLENSSNEVLSCMMEDTWANEHGKVCAGLHWDRLPPLDDLKGLVSCIGGKALSGILERYAKCPRHTRSGFPDLTLWNIETGAWKISEVKGPGDKLSHKQILWLDYLLGLGVDAEVCHVKAVAAKKLRPNT